MNDTFRSCIGAATIVLLLNTSALAAFDVAADWSDANNNGVWSYREGSNTATLVNVPDWQNLNGGSPNQPAWAPSNNSGNFLPAMFKATATQRDWLTGDVVAHTWDPGNGDGHGDANYLFTAPFAGTYSVNGDVWYAAHDINNRPQHWQLLVNNVVLDSGLLTDSVTRASPDTFSFTNLGLTTGDTVELLMFKDVSTPFGWFVGTHLTVRVLAPTLQGDFNGDEKVDAADYVVWRKGLGTTYTQADYDLWRTHFGQTAGSGAGAMANAAVPEPTTLVLLLLAAAGWCLRRGRAA